MVQGFQWWRRFGAAFAAFALALATFAPSLDLLVCHDEAGVAAGHQQTDHDGRGDFDKPAGGQDACVHGHCHHAGAFAPPVLAAADFPANGGDAIGGLARQRVPVSNPQYGLMRPPRA
jgi:hypothetical protein